MKSRKNLKEFSIVVLIFAGLSLLRLLFELCLGELNSMPLPEGVSAEALLVTKIILFCIGCFLTFPQIYIGVRGIMIAKNPTPAKAHIVVAIVLLVSILVTLGTPIINLMNGVSPLDNISDLCNIILNACVTFIYIRYAIDVMKEC